jgi:hypothetical protein
MSHQELVDSAVEKVRDVLHKRIDCTIGDFLCETGFEGKKYDEAYRLMYTATLYSIALAMCNEQLILVERDK